MSNTIVWFTLSAADPDALTSFYGDLLAWEVDEARLTSTDSGVSGKLRTIRTGGLPGSISTEDERGIVLLVEVDDEPGGRPRATIRRSSSSTSSSGSSRTIS